MVAAMEASHPDSGRLPVRVWSGQVAWPSRLMRAGESRHVVGSNSLARDGSGMVGCELMDQERGRRDGGQQTGNRRMRMGNHHAKQEARHPAREKQGQEWETRGRSC